MLCVVSEEGSVVWRGVVDTRPESLARALEPWRNELTKVGLESGSMSPWLARELARLGFAVVCMDARWAADAVRSRRVKSDKADALALAEMLRTGWYSAVHVKSEESHRLKALLGAPRSAGAGQALAGRPGARPVAAVRHPAAGAPGGQAL